MTRLFDISAGQSHELLQALQTGGWSLELAQEVIRQPEIARQMMLAVGTPPYFTLPFTWPSVHDQLQRVRKLNEERDWGFNSNYIVSPPRNFVKRTASELPLLNVVFSGPNGLQRTFDELYECIEHPVGYSKVRLAEVRSDASNLRLEKSVYHPVGVHWVAFDPFAYQAQGVLGALTMMRDAPSVRPAGTEVLMAMVHCPEWVTAWGNNVPTPVLAGLEADPSLMWERFPVFSRHDDAKRLELSLIYDARPREDYSVPTVRTL